MRPPCVTFNVKFCWLAKALKVLAQVPKSNIRMCSALNDANFTLCLTGSQEPWGHAWLVRGGEDVLFPWYRPKRWWTFWSRSKRTFMRRSPVERGRSGRPCLLHSLGVGHWFTYPQQPQGEDLAGRRIIWCHRVIDGYMYLVKRNNVHPMWYYYLKWCCISTDCLNLVYKSGICLIKIVLLIKLS